MVRYLPVSIELGSDSSIRVSPYETYLDIVGGPSSEKLDCWHFSWLFDIVGPSSFTGFWHIILDPSFSENKNYLDEQIWCQSFVIQILDLGWVQHNADSVAHSLWWQVLWELSADDTGVTMGSKNQSKWLVGEFTNQNRPIRTHRVILPQTAVVVLASPPGVFDLFNFL